MAEYIDIAQLWKCETCYYNRKHGCVLGVFGCDHGESYRPAYNKLKKADVEEVKHGRWIVRECIDECNLCHGIAILTPDYCPNCGAKMDGGKDETK